MARVIDYVPEATGEEAVFLDNIMKDYDDEKARSFTNVYRTRRKEPQMILILAILGFVGFAGIHRMVIDQIGMGILYFLTGGLCLIGTIIDLVNHQKLAAEYNQKVAHEVALLVR